MILGTKSSNTLLHDITNSLPHHVVSETPPQAKWKRLQRIQEVLTDTRIDQAGSKRPIYLVIDQCESPNEAKLDYVKDRIQFDKKLFVPRVSNGGGLVLYWKISVEIDIVSSSVNHIDVIVNKNSGDPWRFTGFYGEPETHKRQESWDLLRSLYGQSSLLWLCVGDFNEIVKQSEKLGGRLKSYAQMQIFRDALDECELMDLGFKGFPYTWCKHYRNGVSI
ncbi:hypothetical protein SO802_015104 [Lithocarpus litseifolius]|uniref:Uncharacterized protein n=1 Tax=Lithocarpus litseifolius TaxID=425828 RepID=A0AAW2CST5_9ROSI